MDYFCPFCWELFLKFCSTFTYLQYSTCVGGGQHGCSPQQVLCHSEGPAAQTRGHPGFGLHGARAFDPVLQIDALQANQNHLLQGWCVRGTVQTGVTTCFCSCWNLVYFFQYCKLKLFTTLDALSFWMINYYNAPFSYVGSYLNLVTYTT